MSDNEEKDLQDAENNPEEPAEEPKPAPRKKASRDRNQRVREQAARKLETSKKDPEAKSERPAGAGLDAGEIMDDALARGFAAFIKWIKTNRRGIEIGVAVAILGGIGYATWDWYSAKRHGAASAALYQAVRDEQGIVKPAGTDEPAEAKDEEESRFDTRARFATYDARRDDTLAAYRKAATDYGNTGAGMLARLGEAGVLLDKHDYDGALAAANAVLASELSKADVDVRMSARELVGMALQGKGDLDGAKTAFEDMAASDTAFYKDLGEYHTARILFAKGNKDDAKERLKKLRDKLSTAAPSTEPVPQSEFLKEQVDVLLRAIDPSLAPAEGGGSASQLSPDQLKRLQEEIQRLGGGQPPGAPNEPAPAPGNTP